MRQYCAVVVLEVREKRLRSFALLQETVLTTIIHTLTRLGSSQISVTSCGLVLVQLKTLDVSHITLVFKVLLGYTHDTVLY